jgi:NAD(P)-dependent dehydrogenase (short-subunit alcohol dehydrogenase family)
MAALAVEEFGRIDLLVAAAGISHARYVSGAPADTADARGWEDRFIINKPVEYWEKVLAVNLTGVMMTDRAVAKRMISGGNGGSIINIASGAAKIPLPGSADYCVSKAGVWMLTEVLALEVAQHGIRVNAVGPGYTDTPMTEAIHSNEEAYQRLMQSIPMRRMGVPLDIANTALFLASDESAYFTGQILFPAGGLFTG